MDHSTAHRFTDSGGNTHAQITGKDGYNAELLCFSTNLPGPQTLFLKFDAPDACPPLAGINPSARPAMSGPPKNWMLFTSNYLVFENDNDGVRAGVWLMPVAEIEAALAPLRQAQFAQMARAKVATEQSRKNLMEKYDRNRNGVIDPDERAEALDDPAFIESELEVIDANHNGWLDAEELTYFDANNNNILEPKEQTGIEIAQRLLAERLFAKFDLHNDDALGPRGIYGPGADLHGFAPGCVSRPDLAIQNVDANHDGHVDLKELEAFLGTQTLRGLIRPRRIPGPPPFTPTGADAGQRIGPQQRFKQMVETYWQSAGGVTNQQPKNNATQSTNE